MPAGGHTLALGVLGGMGPVATADFQLRLARLAAAQRDQDHISMIVYSDPSTPDRSDAILGRGPSPLPAMLAGVDFLNRAGCALIAIPCNSAHYWYDELAAQSAAPVLHIADVTAGRLHAGRTATTVGLLATEGTSRSGIYHDRLTRAGIATLDLTDLGEAGVMRGIRALKAGREREARHTLVEAGRELLRRGADVLVVACTDISAALSGIDSVDGADVVDASDCLARAVLTALGGRP
jgi:aspartate racemase